MNIIKGLPREAKNQEMVGIDLEMFGQDENKLHRPHGTFACLSVAFTNGDVYLITDKNDLPGVYDRLKGGLHVYQNALYDIRQLRSFCDIPERFVWDTMLVEQGLFGGYYDRFGLGALARRWLNTYLDKSLQSSFGKASELSPEMELYAGTDALATVLVAQKQSEYVKENSISFKHYTDVDEPAMWAILDIKPVRLNAEGWMELATKFGEMADEIREEMDFNPGSWQQVKKFVEGRLHGSIPNTQKETLLEYVDKFRHKGDHNTAEIIENVLDYRSNRKASSTYGQNWIDNYLEGEYIHAAWRVIGARTGRMACRDPNLQNVPSRKIPEYRNQFIASEECKMIVADVSQQEPAILAYVSNDHNLLAAIRNREDLHLATAKRLFEDDTITKDDPRRRDGKDTLLGTGYGLTAPGMAHRTGRSIEACEELIRKFFRSFPGVETYTRTQRRLATQQGYVETPLGRRTYLNMHHDSWKNKAINAPIQGGASDEAKLALVYLHKNQGDLGYHANMVIHDEIVSDVPEELATAYSRHVEQAWEWAGSEVIPGVPVTVDVAIGDNWGVKR